MAQAQQLQRLNQKGWRVGFGNLLRKESSEWWRTRSWLVHVIVWTLIINGIVAMFVWTAPQAMADEPEPMFTTSAEAGPEAVDMFCGVAGIATAIGVIIVMQGAIMDEKKSGTLEWVLSKPVARPAVILTKLLANGFSVLAIMVLLQGALTYAQFVATGAPPDALHFLGGMGLLALNVVFYLTFTLMLGVVFKNRGAVLGLGMLFVFSYQIVSAILPGLTAFMPWGLVMPVSLEISQGLASTLALSQPLPTVMPVVATAAWIVVMTAVAIWRFDKTEF